MIKGGYQLIDITKYGTIERGMSINVPKEVIDQFLIGKIIFLRMKIKGSSELVYDVECVPTVYKNSQFGNNLFSICFYESGFHQIQSFKIEINTNKISRYD